MNKTRIFLAVAFLFAPLLAFADADKYCTYIQQSGDPVGNVERANRLDDCKKGDVIHIVMLWENKPKLEARFLTEAIAALCDNTLPIATVGRNRAVCTYRGSRRTIRVD